MSRSDSSFAGVRRIETLWIGLVLGLVSTSCAVLTVSGVVEARRVGLPLPWAEIALLEGVSHLVVALLAVAGGLWLLRRTRDAPLQTLWPLLALGFPVFLVVHVGVTYGLRALLFPVVVARPYELHPFRLDVWLYEGPKDLFAYGLLVAGFILARALLVRPAEAPKVPGRMTLRADGAEHLVSIEDIVFAQAAGNYVEIHTQRRRYFVRMTLNDLAERMSKGGGRPVRTHRSYLLNADHVRSIRPTGEGDVMVELSTGHETPGSRRYRDRLVAAVRQPSAEAG